MLKNILSRLGLVAAVAWSSLAQIKNGDQSCDYSRLAEEDGARLYGHCIKNYVSASATLSLPPLLPSPVTFVYAVDELKGSDAESGDPAVDDAAHSLVAFWLDWDGDDVTLQDDALKNPMFTSAGVFLPTVKSKKVGGGHGGCDDLLGKQCIDSLTKTLKKFTFDIDTPGYNSSDRHYDTDFGSPDYPLTLLWNETSKGNISGCPDDFFEDVMSIDDESWGFGKVGSYGNSSMIALQMPNDIEFDDEATTLFTDTDAHVIPPGNSSYTHGRQIYLDRPLSQQKDRAAVVIVLRTQLTDAYYALDKTRDDDTFDLAFACAKLPADAQQQLDGGKGSASGDGDDADDDDDDDDDDGGEDQSGGDDGGGDDDDDAGANVKTHLLAVTVCAFVAVAFLMGP